jgi:integrase
MTLSRISASLSFSVASALWLESRSFSSVAGAVAARYIRKTTEHSYRQYVSSLNLFFGNLSLAHIHLGHLRQYQEARVSGSPPFVRKRRPNKNVEPAPCPVTPKKVNQELSILKMIMRRAGCWAQEMDDFYQPFREDQGEIQRALIPDEQRLWLDCCQLKEAWHVVGWYSVLAFETSMSTNEIRSLRVGDINLTARIINIPAAGAKNRFRQRTIPIHSADGLWAAEQLLHRASYLGARSPQHFLFPFRRPPAEFDPTRPMTVSGIKRSWNEIRAASGLTWFRPYDTRHTAITRWAEGGIRPEIIRAMAGHVSERMMLHYVHICEAAMRKEFDGLPRIGPTGGHIPFFRRTG